MNLNFLILFVLGSARAMANYITLIDLTFSGVDGHVLDSGWEVTRINCSSIMQLALNHYALSKDTYECSGELNNNADLSIAFGKMRPLAFHNLTEMELTVFIEIGFRQRSARPVQIERTDYQDVKIPLNIESRYGTQTTTFEVNITAFGSKILPKVVVNYIVSKEMPVAHIEIIAPRDSISSIIAVGIVGEMIGIGSIILLIGFFFCFRRCFASDPAFKHIPV